MTKSVYLRLVDDVQASLDKAVALGGKIVVPPIKIPTGTFAWFSDIVAIRSGC